MRAGAGSGMGRAVAAGRGVKLDDVIESGRHGHTGARKTGAIGFAALRGGQVVGEHARAGNFTALMGLALAMLVVGLGFKLGIAPFHMWLPDVYHGAPTAVTLPFGTTPSG